MADNYWQQQVQQLLDRIKPPDGPLSEVEMELLQEEQQLLVTHRLVTADIIRPLTFEQLAKLEFSTRAALALQKAFQGRCYRQTRSVSSGCKQQLFDWLLSWLGWLAKAGFLRVVVGVSRTHLHESSRRQNTSVHAHGRVISVSCRTMLALWSCSDKLPAVPALSSLNRH